MDPLEANNKVDVDCASLSNIKSETNWEDLIEVYRQNVEQEAPQMAEGSSEGCCSWTVDESTSNVVPSHPVNPGGAEMDAKLNSTVQVKQEEMPISDDEDNDELKYVPIKAEDIVTSFQSPEGYVDCQDFNNLSSEEYHESLIKDESIIEDEATEYDDDDDCVDNDDKSDEDYLIEYDCKECGSTCQTDNKSEALCKKCKNPCELYEKLKNDPQKVKCLTCEQIVALQRFSAHNHYYHAEMLQQYVCPSKDNSCPYVSISKCNMRLHVSRRHSDENISPKTSLQRKLMPNPRINPNLYALNKMRSQYAKGTTCQRDKVRVFECPSETCNFFSKAKRNVRSHILTHKKDVDSEEFAKLASKCIPTIFIPEELYQSECLSNPPSKQIQMQEKDGEVKKKKWSHFYMNEDKWCCGKAYHNKTRLFEHRKFVHRTHINLYYCPVDGCTVTNLRQHKIRSHIIVVHAKWLEAREIDNFLSPENIKYQEIPNPNYVPLVKDESEASVSDVLYREAKNLKTNNGQKMNSLQCIKCSKTFKWQNSLRRHLREFHDPSKKLLVCPVAGCTLETRRMGYLKDHMERHVIRGEISQIELNDYVKNLKRK